ncbi:Alpha/Beta hydrolase protein [Fomes fomentarius]|nr:Alpha/Beta hydrolase protein [Fomes fomentarius]
MEAAVQFHAALPRLAAIGPGAKDVTLNDPRTDNLLVDGKSIPNITWDIGNSYTGLLHISDDLDNDRKPFFWLFPPGPQGSDEDLIFWTVGGPGCSSLEGLLQENGNEFSWTNLSNVLYLEQPVGTSFSQGKATAKDEEDIAEQIVGFLRQFVDIFSELKSKKLYISAQASMSLYQ